MAAVRAGYKQAKGLSTTAIDVESDYGSDIDEHDISELLLKADVQLPDDIVLTSIEQDPVSEHAVIHLRSSGQEPQQSDTTSEHLTVAVTTKVEYRRRSYTPSRKTPSTVQPEFDAAIAADDKRSPLERFRTHPKKPLSVTDIVSPAWCEQQYLFSLSKHGRVRRTPAMKQGSKVHKVLEEQVHTTVRIEVKSREDMFGLKLWNVIQGLRTLRASGITREMEVWGVLDGQVINGVIDELTTKCPDEALEARLLGRSQDNADKKKEVRLEANQKTLTAFLQASTDESIDASQPEKTPTIYLVDVKTRQSRTLPSNDGRLRPTQMQLMLYHRLLSSLASDEIDKNAIFDRYNLDSHSIFSDTFIAEVSKLDMSSYLDAVGSDNYRSQEDSVGELLANNTLNALWSYMIDEFHKTLAANSPISSILAAEFRAASDGKLIGKRSFEFDSAKLDAYVHDELSWWKGLRSTKGVDIEEAFKCRNCEFAEDCSWRKEKVEEAVQHTRERRARPQQASNG